MQASCPLPDGLSRVQALIQHDAFTMKNPNRMRSVVTSFAFQNIVNFHNKDGSGYGWRKYDQARQALMKTQLERILAADDLSPDVFEIASKSV